jgi:hypothetical protein
MEYKTVPDQLEFLQPFCSQGRKNAPPKKKWKPVNILTLPIILPKLVVTTLKPILTMSNKKKLKLFLAAFKIAITNRKAKEAFPPPCLLMYR